MANHNHQATSRIYADHAATTPLRQVALDAYVEHSHLGNAGGQYASGRAARKVLEQSRETIAELLGCEPIEVLLCASGTEADNMALGGFLRAAQATDLNTAPWRILSSPIEHPAVARTVEALAASAPAAGAPAAGAPAAGTSAAGATAAGAPAAQLDLLPMGAQGTPGSARADVAAYSAEEHASDFRRLRATTVATLQWANNETGALQPLDELVTLRDTCFEHTGIRVPIHSDAVQAVGHVPVNFATSGLDTLAASAHKFGGPRGVGILLARRSPAPKPVLFGGGQERGLRPGTVDVAGAAAAAAALREACAEIDQEHTRLQLLREWLRERIVATIDGVVVHTPPAAGSLPGHLHISIPGAEGDSLIMLLDMAGVEASTGSACANGVNRASEVLLAMGVDEATARGAIRFTLGRTTTQDDVHRIAEILPQIAQQARAAGMA